MDTNEQADEELQSDIKHDHQWEDLIFCTSPDGDYEKCMVCDAIVTKNIIAQHTKEAVEQLGIRNEMLAEYFRLKDDDKAIRAERNEYMAHNYCLTRDADGDCIDKLQESMMGYTLCEVCEKRNNWFTQRQVISHKRSAIMRRLKRLAAPQQSTSPDGSA